MCREENAGGGTLEGHAVSTAQRLIRQSGLLLLLGAIAAGDGRAQGRRTTQSVEARRAAERRTLYERGVSEQTRRALAIEFPEFFRIEREVFEPSMPEPTEAALYRRVRDYSEGDETNHEYVRAAQTALRDVVDEQLVVDGRPGPRTRAALTRFQNSYGLQESGRLDRVTAVILGDVALRQAAKQQRLQPPFTVDARADVPGPRPVVPNFDVRARPRIVELEVREENGAVVVEARYGNEVRRISTTMDLELLAARDALVIHRGLDLPPALAEGVDKLSTPNGLRYLRASARSQRTLAEYEEADALLDMKNIWSRMTVLNGLPGFERGADVAQQLERMGRDPAEAGQWEVLASQVRDLTDDVSRPSAHLPLTREAFLQELANGDQSVVVLLGHVANGRMRLPGGGEITKADLMAMRRDKCPLRAVVLCACETGQVNAELASWSEVIVGNNLAKVAPAAATFLDAREVPHWLRQLSGGKSLRESLPLSAQPANNKIVPISDQSGSR
jgi:peptidoglycan hydrolase-like protein with peptidoglycan-binding domain